MRWRLQSHPGAILTSCSGRTRGNRSRSALGTDTDGTSWNFRASQDLESLQNTFAALTARIPAALVLAQHLRLDLTTCVQPNLLHSTTISTSSSGRTASRAGAASPPWASPSSAGAAAGRPAEMWSNQENFRVEQWNAEILLKALPPLLQAAAKTLAEVREWPGGVTRWPLWSATGRTPSPMQSGETLVGRQQDQSRCGDHSRTSVNCDENEAKFGQM